MVRSIEIAGPDAEISLQGMNAGVYFAEYNNGRSITKFIVAK
jgi:hypothetical protein